jgi:hypothetical protein
VFTNRGTNESISANGASDWLNVESLGASPTGAVFSIVSDSANNWSAASQEPILLDFSTPEITFLNDGVSNDIDTLSTNSIDGNWLITDPHSDIADFQYAVGTLPNLDDVISWTSTGITTSFSDIIANPVYEQVYHISVSAANNAGLIGTFVSDGQIYLENLSELELDLEKIVLYPNPASHTLSIEGVENMSVQIYDNVGRAVTVQLEQSNGLIQLDISQLAVGNYKLVIGNENSFIIRKVQVTR